MKKLNLVKTNKFLGDFLTEKLKNYVKTNPELMPALKFMASENGQNGLIVHVAHYGSEERNSLLEKFIGEWAQSNKIAISSIQHCVPQTFVKWYISNFKKDEIYLFGGIPQLVLYKDANEKVFGYSGINIHFANIEHQFATSYYTPDEAKLALAHKLNTFYYRGLFNVNSIAFETLEEAIKNSPESEQGQTLLMIYDEVGGEWMNGIWNDKPLYDGDTNELSLYSYADFHGTPVFSIKKSKRCGFEGIDFKCKGDWELLSKCAEIAIKERAEFKTNYENHNAIKILCEWWNNNAPEDMRTAKTFRIYVWDEDNLIFNSCDYEEPALNSKTMNEFKPIALFESDKKQKICLLFVKGQDDIVERDHGIDIIDAAGELLWDVGCGKDEYNESYYALTALQNLKTNILGE